MTLLSQMTPRWPETTSPPDPWAGSPGAPDGAAGGHGWSSRAGTFPDAGINTRGSAAISACAEEVKKRGRKGNCVRLLSGSSRCGMHVAPSFQGIWFRNGEKQGDFAVEKRDPRDQSSSNGDAPDGR